MVATEHTEKHVSLCATVAFPLHAFESDREVAPAVFTDLPVGVKPDNMASIPLRPVVTRSIKSQFRQDGN